MAECLCVLVRARLLVLKPVPLGCRTATYMGQANRGGSNCVLIHFINRWGIVLGDVLGMLRNCFRGSFGVSFLSTSAGPIVLRIYTSCEVCIASLLPALLRKVCSCWRRYDAAPVLTLKREALTNR